MIKAVIFDVDNTLTDFMRTKRAAVESAVEGMLDAGLVADKQKMVDKIFETYFKDGVEDQKIFDKILKQETGSVDYKILAAAIVGYRRAKAGSMSLYPHVSLTLTTLLKSGVKMAVVSDAPKLEVWLRIVGLGMHNFFDCVVTAEDAGARKPAAAPFMKALELLGVKPEEAVMVGDWAERDIAGAKKLGIRTAWAKYGDTFDTKESGAEFELADILELLSIVQKENAPA
ncbi:MAG TPA: HAD-IA family hydrolase [Elusimicrobiota bacterium]|nr:HAD-IA family hydrolase [Elusimicrobiota bacterium]